MASSAGAVGGMIGGAILLIVISDYAPRFVTGLLILILVGVILGHSSAYTGLLSKISGQPTSSSSKSN